MAVVFIDVLSTWVCLKIGCIKPMDFRPHFHHCKWNFGVQPSSRNSDAILTLIGQTPGQTYLPRCSQGHWFLRQTTMRSEVHVAWT
jgi:hypothetical protein